jgi:ppGpp synthetase/RelA/SpoT-type nucleotidyltranferase
MTYVHSMAPRYIAVPSNGQVNRSGALLARAMVNEPATEAEWEEIVRAYDVVTLFRSAHAAPMNSVAMGLRSMVRTATGTDRPAVSQRLKRVPRIIRKIHRMDGQPDGSTNLARLEDIGGVRAVLDSLEDLHRVRERLERTWAGSIKRQRDLITEPRDIGYRAHHVVVERRDRRIEVQLRTVGQQRWADAIEALDSRRGLNLKDGIGPQALVEYFRAASDFIYHEDQGQVVPADLASRLTAATERVIDEGYYSRRRGQ